MLQGSELADILGLLAVIVAVAGVVAGIWFYAKFGTTTVGGGLFDGPAREEANPYVLLVAIATVMSGVIWSALLAGIARAIRNTIDLSAQIVKLSTH